MTTFADPEVEFEHRVALEARRQLLAHLLQHHQGLDDIEFQPGDDDLLHHLASSRHLGTPLHAALEAWAVKAYTEKTGFYSTTGDRVDSRLPDCVYLRAADAYVCPLDCPNHSAPGCDGCPACEGHRRQADDAYALYRRLDQLRWEAFTQDVDAGLT